MFSNCLAGLPFIALSEARARFRNGQAMAGAGLASLSLLAFALWLGAVGYCGYRAYLAIP